MAVQNVLKKFDFLRPIQSKNVLLPLRIFVQESFLPTRIFASCFSQKSVKKQPTRNVHVGAPLSIKASLLTKENLVISDTGCPICRANVTFTYKDVLFLAQFLSPEGNLLNRKYTGVCGKQQRKLEKQVKIARRAGLLPKCGPIKKIEDAKK